jgi:hypothetical protein
MNDKVRIFEDVVGGRFEVVHDGAGVASFYYCTNENEQCYLSRKAAKKLATKVARYMVSRGTSPTTKGIGLNQIYFNIDV